MKTQIENNNLIYDVVIIGGGPSGSTLARFLDNKYKVLILDKKPKKISDNREKCCGGLLAPEAQKMLAKLNLGVPKDVLEGPQIFSVKTLDFDNNLKRHYQRYYININRAKFDRWLLSLVGDNVKIMYDTIYQKHKYNNEVIDISAICNNKSINIKGKILVGADGAISKVRKNTFDTKNPTKYIAIQKWYETEDKMPYYISVFDKQITDFYSWVIKKDNKLIIGGAIKEQDNANEKLDILINKLIANGYDIGKLVKKEGTFINRTRNLNQISLVKDNVALVGEAASLISPSSAEGISYGLKSGYYLAKAINSNIQFKKQYLKSIRKIKFNIFLKNLKIPFIYNNLLRKIIMKLKVLSLKINT